VRGNPWKSPHPIVLDTTAALALGYTPVGDYAHTVSSAVDWMTCTAEIGDDGRAILSGVDNEMFKHMFDYEREDRYIATERLS